MGRRCGPGLKACLAFLFLLCLLPLRASGAEAPLILAVHPYLPAAEIQERFAPLANYLAKALGRPVQVRVGRTYGEHLAAIGRDQVDIAFLGPAGYIAVSERYARKPLLAGFEVEGRRALRGVIAVRRDSSIQALAELKGRYFAFGDPESTMSHFVPRDMLRQAGVGLNDLGGYRYLGSHRNVALGILAGDFDAGAMKREVYDEFAPRGLRALATSPPFPDHLFVTRSDLPAATVRRLRSALLDLVRVPGGDAILKGVQKGLTALVPVRAADYDALRTLLRRVGPAQP